MKIKAPSTPAIIMWTKLNEATSSCKPDFLRTPKKAHMTAIMDCIKVLFLLMMPISISGSLHLLAAGQLPTQKKYMTR